MTVLRWVYPPGAPPSVLAEPTAVIGRDPSCQVRLDTRRVSRRHAEVAQVDGRCFVRDLGSKNGVYVNGARVAEAALGNGDILRLGKFLAVVESVDAGGLAGARELGHGIVGGPVMARVLERAQALASCHASVLLHGEAGTGKELLARAIHRASGRSGPFLLVRAASATRGDLEGLATGGTLYFDALSELALELQAELVPALEREEQRARASEPGAGARFIFANELAIARIPARRLDAALRAELEERVVMLPPLRERRADIVPLFFKFLGAHGEPPPLEYELVERLCLAPWPLNVLELEQATKRLLSLYPNQPELKLSQLLEALGTPVPPALPPNGTPSERLRRASSYPPELVAALREALERHSGNLTRAANELGITRPKAYRMLDDANDE